MELPDRLGWLKSARVLRLLSVAAALAVLAAILYNAIMVDRIPPTYSIKVSNPAGSLALTLTSIDVEFSEQVRHPTAEAAFSMAPSAPGSASIQGTFHWQDPKMIFTPSAKLPPSTSFHVHIAPGVQDLAGNVQSNGGDLTVTTVGPPTVTSIVPATGLTAVDVNASILITFDRLMDTQKVIAGLSLQPDITYQASWNGNVLTLDPTTTMQYGTTYTVRIGDPAVDTDGTKLPPYVSTFKTVDVGLRVSSTVPAANSAGVSIHSQIAVTYDGPIDPASISSAISLTPPVSGSIKAVSLPDDTNPPSKATPTPATPSANVLVFTPDNPLAPHTTYAVTLSSSVKQADGQVSMGQTWSFITGEAPTNALNQIAFMSDRSGVSNLWLMNPDGSNQREVTAELVPVSGYDVSGDGQTVVYAAGGVVKKMSIGGDSLTTLTAAGSNEYAPTFTPDGTGVVVGRRDSNGVDVGFWRYSLAGGTDSRQVAPDGAPGLGSVALGGTPAAAPRQVLSSWAPRAAFTQDGATMMIVRGADDAVELVDMTAAAKPVILSLQGNSRPVWVPADGAFYLTASNDKGATWACWRVTPAGATAIVGPAVGDLAAAGRALALIVKAGDGSNHLGYSPLADGSVALLTDNAVFRESSPSFSPDGKTIVFARIGSQTPDISAGIWTINADGTGVTNLSTDGAYPRWLP